MTRKNKVEDAKAKGYSDPGSEAQIKVIEAVLTEHRALYEKVSVLRDAEQGKEFELPVQGTDLSRFQPTDIGGYDKYAVRYGKGPEFAKQEDIEKLVDLKKITAYYATMKSSGGGFHARDSRRSQESYIVHKGCPLSGACTDSQSVNIRGGMGRNIG